MVANPQEKQAVTSTMKTLIPCLLTLSACAESLVPNAGPGGPGQAAEASGADMGAPTINEMPPIEAVFQATEDAIILAGNIAYDGEEEGNLLLQFLREKKDQPIALLHSEERSAIGAFEIKVPRDLGEISAVAFLDLDGDDKPTPNDLGGRFDLVVEQSDVRDIQIDIGSIDSLGSLMPGRLLPGTGEDNPKGEAKLPQNPPEPPGPTGTAGPETPEGPPMDGSIPPPAPEAE